MLSNSDEFWESAWTKYFDRYAGTVPRQAYYLYFILPLSSKRVVELGAGSFRDSARLNDWCIDCTGTDFSSFAVEKARTAFATYAERFVEANSFSLPFKDNSFDICFHNGLLVCFEKERDLHTLLEEQARISRCAVVCTVHNKANARLLSTFRERSKKDKLYDIRFFGRDELAGLMRPYFNSVSFRPFGHPTFDLLINTLKNRHLLRLLYLSSYRTWNLSRCERIMAVGTVT